MENIHSTKKVDGIQPEKHQNVQDAMHDTKAVLAHTHHLFRKIAKNVDEASSKKSREKQMEESIATLKILAKTADPNNQYKLQEKINDIHQRDALVLAGKKIPKDLKKKLDDLPDRIADDMKMPGLATLLGNLVGSMSANRIMMMKIFTGTANFSADQLQQVCKDLSDACVKIAQAIQEQNITQQQQNQMKSLSSFLNIFLAVVSVVVAAVTMGAAAALIAVAATIVNLVPVKDGKTSAQLLAEAPGMDSTKAAGVLCGIEIALTLGSGALSGVVSRVSQTAIEEGTEMSEMGVAAIVENGSQDVAENGFQEGAEGAPGSLAAGAARGGQAAVQAEEGIITSIKNALNRGMSAATNLKAMVGKAIDEFFEPWAEAANEQFAKLGYKIDFSKLSAGMKLALATGFTYNNPMGPIATSLAKEQMLRDFRHNHGRDPTPAELNDIEISATYWGVGVGTATSFAAASVNISGLASDVSSANANASAIVQKWQQFRQMLLDNGFRSVATLIQAGSVATIGGLSVKEGLLERELATFTQLVGQGEHKALSLRSAKELLENMQNFVQSQESAAIDMQSKQIQGLVDSVQNFFKL